MYKFNKLEKLLESIVEGKKANDNDPNLTFDLGEHLLIFSRDEGSAMCYLDCVSHNSFDKKMARYNEKFEFELPLIHIQHFMMKHINVELRNTHFLLTYPASYNTEDLEEVYNNLIEKINITPNFFSAFLPAVLNKELPVNADSSSKKLKI